MFWHSFLEKRIHVTHAVLLSACDRRVRRVFCYARPRSLTYHMRKRNEKAMGKKVKPRELWAQRVLQPLPES